jgi:hypothetical protein
LRPGGGLFIDTPNIESIGHEIYGADWLHLDPPRHLLLFNRSSLADAVSGSGFQDLRFHRRPDAFRGSAEASRRMIAGADPMSVEALPAMPPPPSLSARMRAAIAGKRSEFLTLTAIKPSR